MEEKLDPRILAHGGKVKMMWWPDEPVFYNVTQRRRIPMALPPNVRQVRSVGLFRHCGRSLSTL